jgi:hypothetical protein
MAMSAVAAESKAKKGDSATTRPSQRETVKSVRGEIASVDIEAKTITVEVKRKQEIESVVVTTDPNTEYLLDSEVVSIVDLRPGMRVSFQPESGVATRVSAKSMSSKEQKEYKERRAALGESKEAKE